MSGWGVEYLYGLYGIFGFFFIGYGVYIFYLEVFYGDFWLYYGFVLNGFIKLNILSKKLKKVSKKDKNEEKVISRYFVVNFYLGCYGWGGVLYFGYGYY